MSRQLISRQKLWAANAHGRYMWCIKLTYSDGTVDWEYAG
jgi:hypothetical protein